MMHSNTTIPNEIGGAAVVSQCFPSTVDGSVSFTDPFSPSTSFCVLVLLQQIFLFAMLE